MFISTCRILKILLYLIVFCYFYLVNFSNWNWAYKCHVPGKAAGAAGCSVKSGSTHSATGGFKEREAEWVSVLQWTNDRACSSRIKKVVSRATGK